MRIFLNCYVDAIKGSEYDQKSMFICQPPNLCFKSQPPSQG